MLSFIQFLNFVFDEVTVQSRNGFPSLNFKLAMLTKTLRTLQPRQKRFLLHHFCTFSHRSWILLCLEVYCLKTQYLICPINKTQFSYCSSVSCVSLPLKKLRARCENGSWAACENTNRMKSIETFKYFFSLEASFWLALVIYSTLHLFFNVCTLPSSVSLFWLLDKNA